MLVPQISATCFSWESSAVWALFWSPAVSTVPEMFDLKEGRKEGLEDGK